MQAFVHAWGYYSGILSAFLCLFLFILSAVFIRRRTARNFPPGPLGLPVVGVLPFLGKDPQSTLMQWAKRYGEVFSVNLGGNTVVVLNGVEAVRDAFQRKATVFAGRPRIPSFDFLHHRGIISADYGPAWQAHREFLMRYLRGTDEDKLEEKINREIDTLIEFLRHKNKSKFNCSETLMISVANILMSVLFGDRFDYDNPMLKELIRSIHRSAELSNESSVMNFIPILRFLPQCIERNKEVDNLCNIVGNIQRNHSEIYCEGVTRGLMDAYTKESMQRTTAKSGFFNEKELATLLVDVIIAGTESIATTLSWGILFLLHDPKVQQNVQSELDEVIGKRRPTLADKPNLPYTNATLMEIQRCNYVFPLGVLHSTTKDIEFRGHRIPKGCWILANFWSVMMNDDVYLNPREFRPERFLGDSGKLQPHDAFLPFSAGKRSCAGELLARQQLFLMFTHLLQAFTFQLPEGSVLPKLEGSTGITYQPPKFDVCAHLRF
ncbi:cytochrome P450 2D20 [Lingula anatina]|uniref:Steroid 21-hydroxylase n=1 Tax=Lingula anatina TaxID=7574 RepID=A0A1S3JSV4_LINAN|nr:cytochrome P450 2D20 [Lingula anatina]|eukprot:XP_013413433.2 cytochrome P450 2D20 [Lingula anatina]